MTPRSLLLISLLMLLLVPLQGQALVSEQWCVDVELRIVDINTNELITDDGFMFIKVNDDIPMTLEWWGEPYHVWIWEGEQIQLQVFIDGYQPGWAQIQIPYVQSTEGVSVDIELTPRMDPNITLRVVPEQGIVELMFEMPQYPPSHLFGWDEFTDWGAGHIHSQPILVIATRSPIDYSYFYSDEGLFYCGVDIFPIERSYGTMLFSNYYGLFNGNDANLSIALFESLDLTAVQETGVPDFPKDTVLQFSNGTLEIVGNITIIERDPYRDIYVYYEYDRDEGGSYDWDENPGNVDGGCVVGPSIDIGPTDIIIGLAVLVIAGVVGWKYPRTGKNKNVIGDMS